MTNLTLTVPDYELTKTFQNGWYSITKLTFFPLSFSIDFFLLCQKSASYSREIIENRKFAVQIEILPKNISFYHTTTYSRVCSSDHTYTKNSFLVGFLGLGVIYSEKKLGL